MARSLLDSGSARGGVAGGGVLSPDEAFGAHALGPDGEDDGQRLPGHVGAVGHPVRQVELVPRVDAAQLEQGLRGK